MLRGTNTDVIRPYSRVSASYLAGRMRGIATSAEISQALGMIEQGRAVVWGNNSGFLTASPQGEETVLGNLTSMQLLTPKNMSVLARYASRAGSRALSARVRNRAVSWYMRNRLGFQHQYIDAEGNDVLLRQL